MPTNYNNVAKQYHKYRKADPRIAELIWKHLGDAKRILNVGAGIGSYEPEDRDVVALEPFENMIALRAETAAPAHQGSAEEIPFGDNEFDAAMAILTIHHWRRPEAYLDADVRDSISAFARLNQSDLHGIFGALAQRSLPRCRCQSVCTA